LPIEEKAGWALEAAWLFQEKRKNILSLKVLNLSSSKKNAAVFQYVIICLFYFESTYFTNLMLF
jgi:hypothetical protein